MVGDQSNTTTLNVTSSAPFSVGQTLTIPQTNASGTITSTTRVITNIAGNTLTLATAVATTAGQRVVNGAVVSLACGTANPTPYPTWPDLTAGNAVLKLGGGGTSTTRGGVLTFAAPASTTETLTDNAGVTPANLMNATTAPNTNSRLLYLMNPLTEPARISGTPTVTIKAAFDDKKGNATSKANLTAVLAHFPATGTGNGTIITQRLEGPGEPHHRVRRRSRSRRAPSTSLNFDMQPRDVVIPAGRRLGARDPVQRS